MAVLLNAIALFTAVSETLIDADAPDAVPPEDVSVLVVLVFWPEVVAVTSTPMKHVLLSVPFVRSISEVPGVAVNVPPQPSVALAGFAT
jgi:hypothetical protein